MSDDATKKMTALLGDYSIEEKIKELDREIMQRHRVYKRMIDRQQLSPAVASRQIAILSAIKRDYEARAKEGPLFR